MRVSWTEDGPAWRLSFRLDPEEEVKGTVTDGHPIELSTNVCHVRLGRAVPDIHPDLMALAAWTVVAPWTRRRVTFDRPVSAAVARALHDGWGVEAGPVGADPRTGARLAISYSGGADSAAVAAILPEAPLLTFQRISHPRVPNRWTHYRSDTLAQLARDTGRDVTVVQSDLEFLVRHPRPGYPEHHAVAIGAILLAGELDLGGVAFGYEIGSRWLGGGRYVHRFTPDNPMWSAHGPWGRLFTAAGLSLVLPVAGISEAMTMRIALGSVLRDQVRWCLRGDRAGPCGRCGKCLYKELIQAAIERRPLQTTITADRPVARKWQQPPPYGGQEMIEYGCARVPGIETTPFATAAGHLQATEESTRWLERCYPPAVDEVAEPWRTPVGAYMTGHFGLMDDDDIRRVENWGSR
jgi:hypothetical protein